LTLEHYKIQTDEAIQNSILAHIIDIVFSSSDKKILQEVFAQTTLDERVQKIVNFSDSQHIYGSKFIKLMVIALVNRVKIILNRDVKISSITKSTATLIRAKTATISNISEDYGLNSNFKQKINVTHLDGNHFTLLENPLLLEILNKIHADMQI
jgi:fatty acid synthase